MGLFRRKQVSRFYLLRNEDLVVYVNNLGAELMSVKDAKNKTEYIWNGDPEYWGRRSPILFPFVGALGFLFYPPGGAFKPPGAPFLILRPNSPTLLRYSLRLGSMQFPALRPALPERLRGWVVLRGRSSHPADSPPIRRDNTTLTRKMRRVLPEAT